MAMTETYMELPIDLVDRNPANKGDRIVQDEEDEALVESLREHGQIQPIVVVRVGERYRIVAGERRWWAARNLGLTTIKALVHDAVGDQVDEREKILVENLARRDLPAWEAMNALAEVVRSKRVSARAQGGREPSVEMVAKRCGMGRTLAERYWTAIGRLDQESVERVSLTPVLRRHLSLADIERLCSTHLDDRPDLLLRLQALYEHGESAAAAARRRGATAGRLRCGKIVVKEARREIGRVTLVQDVHMAPDPLQGPVVDLRLALNPSIDMVDPASRAMAVARLKRTFKRLLSAIEKGDGITAPKLPEDIAIVPSRTYHDLEEVGDGEEEDEDGEQGAAASA